MVGNAHRLYVNPVEWQERILPDELDGERWESSV